MNLYIVTSDQWTDKAYVVLAANEQAARIVLTMYESEKFIPQAQVNYTDADRKDG